MSTLWVVTYAHEAKSVAVSGFDATDKIRLRLKSIEATGLGSISNTEVHGFVGTRDLESGVTYQTGADNYASQTPDSEDTGFLSGDPAHLILIRRLASRGTVTNAIPSLSLEIAS